MSSDDELIQEVLKESIKENLKPNKKKKQPSDNFKQHSKQITHNMQDEPEKVQDTSKMLQSYIKDTSESFNCDFLDN